MGKWYGAAGVCVKDNKVLMVLQGTVLELTYKEDSDFLKSMLMANRDEDSNGNI